MNSKYFDVCECLDWTVHEYEGGAIYLSKCSPAGEDFGFEVSSEHFMRDVKEYAAYFDVDEHVELWIDSRGEGGVPSSILELVEDAKAIDEMLQELAAALAEVEDAENDD